MWLSYSNLSEDLFFVINRSYRFPIPSIMLSIEPRMVSKLEHVVQPFFKHMSVGYPLLDPHPTTHHLKIGVRLRWVLESRPFTF